jgi:hypothetical protein
MHPMSDLRDSIEYKLVRDAMLLEIQVVESETKPTVGNEDWAVRMQLRVDEELLDSCAHGLVFAVAALSFHDARPRGISGEWFQDGDQFTAADLLQHIRFDSGHLHLYIDYLRGRCLKTTVEIAGDGKVRLETINRGKAATAWVARLQGKKLLERVGG